MPKPSIDVTLRNATREIAKLEAVFSNISSIPINMRYLISEVLLIRACSIFEHAISEIAYKISSGAVYLDSSIPCILHVNTSTKSARLAMMTIGREKPIAGLKWTRAKFIKQSVRHVISPGDNFIIVSDRFGENISEVFKVRNFAAHRNNTSRKDFKLIIRQIYGVEKSMQLGNFLLSSNYVEKPNLQRYFVEIKVILNELCKK